MTIDLASVSNSPAEAAIRPPVEHVPIYRAKPGAAYSHHGHLAWSDGALIASWSLGERDEDRPGQHTVYAVSRDWGSSWSDPVPILPPQPGRFGAGVLTNNGILVTDDGLIAFAGYYDVTEISQLMYYATGGNAAMHRVDRPFYDKAHTIILRAAALGHRFEATADVVPRSVMNLCPSRLASGRLLYPGNVRYWYTDDPHGRTGWKPTGLPGLPDDYEESPAGFHTLTDRPGFEHSPCEASFYETSDGAIHMMHRTEASRLAVSRSEDDGETWGEAKLTGYTDCRSRIHFGNLPDGRAFGLSTPVPGSPRTPLALTVSDDGYDFDRSYLIGSDDNFLARLPGVHKYGRYGYPYACIADGALFVLFSVNKEDVWCARVALSEIR